MPSVLQQELWLARQLDILANRILGGRNETISAALGRKLATGRANPMERAVCDALDVIDPGHCRAAFLATRAAPTFPACLLETVERERACDLCEDWCS